jgi:hypothetical protein
MRSLALIALWAAASAGPVLAQRSLDEAAAHARSAWLAHDAGGLASAGDSIALRLPGVDEVTVGSGQASRLLNRYLQPASEKAFDLRTVRSTGEEQGYAEATRRYAVRGTTDELSETVFLGFRRAGAKWRLTEIRVTP